MYPLAYQVLPTSCWVTSMINGILFLNDGKRVPFMAYRLLHDLLIEEGVFYYTKKQKKEYEAIVSAVGVCTGLEITYVTGQEVEATVKSPDYEKQVVVCDISGGDHSILINGYKDGIFQAFDPYWEHVEKSELVKDQYETYSPYMDGSDNAANVRIWEDHLFSDRAVSLFQMGALSWRFATVMTKTG